MTENRIILHCGFIKSASTSLQYELVKSNKNFIGFDPSCKNDKFYSDDELANFFEQVVRFADCSIYNKSYKKIQKRLDQILLQSENDMIISNENLLGKIYPFDLPNRIKIQRFTSVLPNNSVILIIIRDLKELFYSWYKNLVSIGYSENYLYFINEIKIMDKYMSYFDSFNLQKIIHEIKNYRPDLKIEICSIDDKKNFNKILKRNRLPCIKSIKNKGLQFSNYQDSLELNKNKIRGLRFLDWIDIHRIFTNLKINENIKYQHSRLRRHHAKEIQKQHLIHSFSEDKLNFFNNLPKKIEKISMINKVIYDKQV